MSTSYDGALAPEAPTDGFPDGTIIVTVPATCPDPGTYVTPSCAHETQQILIPMDTSSLELGALPPTGNEPGSAILTAAVLFSAAIAAMRSSAKKRRAAQ